MLVTGLAVSLAAQGRAAPPDWKAVEPEALGHYQALIRFDTSATERAEAEYLKRLFDQHGIPAQVLVQGPRAAQRGGAARRAPAASARSCCWATSTP